MAEQIVWQNVPALFALAGVIVGAVFAFLGTWLLKRRELELRLREKVLDKRVHAHEQVIQLAQSLRVMTPLRYRHDGGEVSRTPAAFSSKEAFDKWHAYFTELLRSSAMWLSTGLVRELMLFQDYTLSLRTVLERTSPDLYPEVGRVVREDFVQFSSLIEQQALGFFLHDLSRLRANTLQRRLRYPRRKADQRLRDTALYKRHQELEALLGLPGGSYEPSGEVG